MPFTSINDTSGSSLFVSAEAADTSNSSFSAAPDTGPEKSTTILFVQSIGRKIGCAGFDKTLKKLTCFLDMAFAGFDHIEEFTALYTQSECGWPNLVQ